MDNDKSIRGGSNITNKSPSSKQRQPRTNNNMVTIATHHTSTPSNNCNNKSECINPYKNTTPIYDLTTTDDSLQMDAEILISTCLRSSVVSPSKSISLQPEQSLFAPTSYTSRNWTRDGGNKDILQESRYTFGHWSLRPGQLKLLI